MFGRPRDQLLGRSARTLFAISNSAEKVAVDHVFDALKAANSDRTEVQLNMLRHENAADTPFPAKLTLSLQGGYLVLLSRIGRPSIDKILYSRRSRTGLKVCYAIFCRKK
eukprot:ANDGO_04714.mRNA.1 hypothetical protein